MVILFLFIKYQSFYYIFLYNVLEIITIIVTAIKKIVLVNDRNIFTFEIAVEINGAKKKLNVGKIKRIDMTTSLPLMNTVVVEETSSGIIPEKPRPTKNIAIKLIISVLEIVTNIRDSMLRVESNIKR